MLRQNEDRYLEYNHPQIAVVAIAESTDLTEEFKEAYPKDPLL